MLPLPVHHPTTERTIHDTNLEWLAIKLFQETKRPDGRLMVPNTFIILHTNITSPYFAMNIPISTNIYKIEIRGRSNKVQLLPEIGIIFTYPNGKAAPAVKSITDPTKVSKISAPYVLRKDDFTISFYVPALDEDIPANKLHIFFKDLKNTKQPLIYDFKEIPESHELPNPMYGYDTLGILTKYKSKNKKLRMYNHIYQGGLTRSPQWREIRSKLITLRPDNYDQVIPLQQQMSEKPRSHGWRKKIKLLEQYENGGNVDKRDSELISHAMQFIQQCDVKIHHCY